MGKNKEELMIEEGDIVVFDEGFHEVLSIDEESGMAILNGYAEDRLEVDMECLDLCCKKKNRKDI